MSFVPPPVVHVPGKPLWMTSFSNLTHHAERAASERLFLKTASPRDYDNSIKDCHTLPANSDTGLIVHQILEKINFIDFRCFEDAEQALSIVSPLVQKSSFEEWDTTIATLIFNTLKTPLTQIDETFCLAHIEPINHYREMPFMFPYMNGEGIEDIFVHDGLIKGVIDFFFYHEGFYYLIDWKTNWLGPRSEVYEDSLLEAAMRENAYFLQASIYTEAVKRYLKVVDQRPFEECFGGAIYLFLRGLEPGRKTGIYHFFPKKLIF